jgi:S-adenosylmethionine:tRNA ribosyltransferase-isomerase
LRLDDFDFDLPDEAIARFPTKERDGSRLMVIDRGSGSIAHHTFADLPRLLRAGDLLVVNDTRVLAARLRAHKKASGGRVEILLVQPESDRRWRAMVAASKPVREGALLLLDLDPSVEVKVAREEGDGFVLLDFPSDPVELARLHGEIPLPPYLSRAAEESDKSRYQTVFARADAERSVAAPTAGLHFTPRLFDALDRGGVERAAITLHVGPGTFLPVRALEVEEHRMLPERFEISESAARAIRAAREQGRRVIAVGTTVTRVLESSGSSIEARSGTTDLFIRPGHRFQVVDAMVTNFHLPRSTLIMLVSAFAGRERILGAYRQAIEAGYRFFSYGDATLII